MHKAALWGRSPNLRAAVSRPGSQGQALVEFALTVPVLILLVAFAVNFGGWLYAWIEVASAARAGANYAALGPASFCNAPSCPLATPSTPQVTAFLNADPDLSSLTCRDPVITNPPDPEGPSYVAVSVAITCTYTPLIPGLGFPTLSVGRQTVMRVIQ